MAIAFDWPDIERRFERKGEVDGISLVDDYGHHPAEIRATLASAREGHSGRIVVAFQPHRYTRTRDLWDDFTSAFNHADVLLITPIYPASEPEIPGVESAPLVEAIRAHGHRDVHFVADLAALPERLASVARRGDLLVTLGAGDISSLGEPILAALEARS